MYIPTSYFSSQGPDEFLIASGGFETTWISGSFMWKSHIFLGDAIPNSPPIPPFTWVNETITGSFVVQSGNTSNARILLVGGGGNDGADAGTVRGGGGAGGGTTQFNNINLTTGSYRVICAKGENKFVSTTGSGSAFSGSTVNISVLGGGGGGDGNQNGKSGGSGGGAGGNASKGFGTPGQGFDGGEDFAGPFGTVIGGAGGGSGQVGGVNTRGPGVFDPRRNGGDGKISTLYYGVSAYYGGGAGIPGIEPDAGVNGLGYFGGGGEVSGQGVVIISYPFKPISTIRTQLVRFTPTIASGTLEYVEAVSGLLKQLPFTTTSSIDLCIISGSQWNILAPSSSITPLTAGGYPIVRENGSATLLSTNSCL
jgi:hypothetical protein